MTGSSSVRVRRGNLPPTVPEVSRQYFSLRADAESQSGLLGLTEATSKAGPAGDWAAGWDANLTITAGNATTTTLF